MAAKVKDMWLKVLIGFLMSLIILVFGASSTGLEKKLDKETFDRHEKYEAQQFEDIKKSLERIEDNQYKQLESQRSK